MQPSHYYQPPMRYYERPVHHHNHYGSIPQLPRPMMAAPVRREHSPVSSPSSDSNHKCSLAFILSEPTPAPPPTTTLKRSHSDFEATSSDADSQDERPISLKHKRRAGTSPVSAGSKSKYCIVDGCTSRAKHARKCWRHGGSIKCKVQDCINRAKSRGVCWSHGGGTTCSQPNCGTIAVSHGFCWAHGGGKRCQVGGCSRPAYERTENLCSTHFKQQKTKASSKAPLICPKF